MNSNQAATSDRASNEVRQLRRADGCSHPIRLRGRQHRFDLETGEIVATIDASAEPGGLLVVACGDRRAVKCSSCARKYQGDAFHLVAAGLRGGKGVSPTVAEHPTLMLTLTAPSFGRVHTIRHRDGGCACGKRHAPTDAVLGTPLNPDTYRYREQAIWNHCAPMLWKRTAQGIRRRLAQELGLPRKALSRTVRIRFVKVAEFQRRGVVHFHVLIRADGSDGRGSRPPESVTAALLHKVVVDAARAARMEAPEMPGHGSAPMLLRWGRQLDVQSLDQATASRAAGYVAKYATKATEIVAGRDLLIPRLRSLADADGLDLPCHARELIKASWWAGRVPELSGARRWAHQFGYGGHTLTKSQGFSVTFTELRAARAAWHSRADGHETGVAGRLKYDGRGYSSHAHKLLTALENDAGVDR